MPTVDCSGFDYSLFNPTQFGLKFSHLPHMNFWLQSVNLPDVSIQAARQSTPLLDFPWPGEKLEYGALTCSILLDDKLKTYKELYSWMVSNTTSSTSRNNGFTLSDAILTMSSSSVNFVDVFPISMSQIPMTIATDVISPVTFTAVFAYSKFDIF